MAGWRADIQSWMWLSVRLHTFWLGTALVIIWRPAWTYQLNTHMLMHYSSQQPLLGNDFSNCSRMMIILCSCYDWWPTGHEMCQYFVLSIFREMATKLMHINLHTKRNKHSMPEEETVLLLMGTYFLPPGYQQTQGSLCTPVPHS